MTSSDGEVTALVDLDVNRLCQRPTESDSS
jgi:hypothetical protein